MEIFRYNPDINKVQYCLICRKKRWSSDCKCDKIPLKITNNYIVKEKKYVRAKHDKTRDS